MFLRVLDSIDAEVVDRDIERTPQRAAAHTHAMEAIAEAWFTILVTFETSNDVIVSSTLETIAKYISWIDIRLIVNDRFVALLFRFMANAEQREHACECFVSIVDKGLVNYRSFRTFS